MGTYAVRISLHARMELCSYVWININYVFVCAAVHTKSVRCTVCLTALSLSVCVDVCAHVCLYDGGGGRAGIKQTRSTSQRLGGPSPALMATYVNPTTPKNRSVEHNTHRDAQTTHAPVSTQRAVCQARHCLVARLRPTFNTAMHIFPRNRYRRPLDWNNRIKRAERE